MEFRCPMHPSIMRNRFSILLMLTTLLFSQCRKVEKAMVVPTNDQMHCQNMDIHIPRYTSEIIVKDIFYEKDTIRIDILPVTFDMDTSDLFHTIQKHFKYSPICLELEYQGKVYFEISKDSIGNFNQTKVLRGLDGIGGTCSNLVSMELIRILKIAPIIGVKKNIDSFILAIQIIIRKD